MRNAWQDKIFRRVLKRQEGKPLATKLIANRTFGSALGIVGDLANISPAELTQGLNSFKQFAYSERFSKPCQEQLELASTDSEKFILGLHKFYLDIAAAAKKENCVQNLLFFLSLVMKANVMSTGFVSREVANAYTNLMLEFVEYVRPNKLDVTQDVRGIGVNGDLLIGNALYPYSDLPMLEIELSFVGGQDNAYSRKQAEADIMRRYHELGMPIKSIQDVSSFEVIMQLTSNEYAAVLSSINEYTYDILPQKPTLCQTIPLEYLYVHSRYSDAYLFEAVRWRTHTLPANGVRFTFSPNNEIKSLMLKEVIVDGNVQVLYSLDAGGDVRWGCFEPSSGYIFTALHYASESFAEERFTSLFLNLYASQVLDLDIFQALTIEQATLTEGAESVKVQIERMDGPLINWYDRIEHPNEPPTPPLLNRVNAEIRKLPAGVEAPEDAKATARALGYELNPDEVLLLPYRLDNKIQTFRLLG